MTAIIHNRPGDVAAFVGLRLGCSFERSPYTAIGMEREGRIVAGVVFTNYRWPDVSVSVAVEPAARPSVRPLLIAAGRYAFIQLGLRRITAEVSEHNRASRIGCERMGFVLEGVKRGAEPDGSARLVYGLLASEFGIRRKPHGI